MKLVIDKKLANNNYEVVISLDEITEAETELFADFGKVQINVGGELKGKESKVVTDGEGNETTEVVDVTIASLGDSFKYLPDSFPITKVFTQSQYGANAEKIAKAYVQAITERVETAVEALKAKQDDFSGVEEIVI